MTNQSPVQPFIATCLRCGRQYSPTAEGDRLFCGECLATRPRIGVTTILIALNVLVFVAMVIGGVSPMEPTSRDLLTWGASDGPYEFMTEWRRLFTARFVTCEGIHVLPNLYSPVDTGPLEDGGSGWWKSVS